MNIAVIDDLESDQKILSDYLQRYFAENPLDIPYTLTTFTSGEDFLQHFTKYAYELIFIDYYMKGLSGFETAKIIRSTDRQAILIFTTVSRDYAVDCYKVKASGYLLKPVQYKDLAEIIALNDIKMLKDRQFIEVENGMEKIKILVKDIIFCDISGHYTQIHTESSGIKRVRMSFSGLTQLLAPFPEFLSCYRGCLININHIEKIDDFNILMQCGEKIPFRRKDQAKIMNLYSEYLFEKVRNQSS